MRQTEKITVLLADDHAQVRHGLRSLLGKDAQIRVVGEARNGKEAVEMARRLQPNVILMDISMPLMNGLEATRLILAEPTSTKVIILSAQVDEEYKTRAKIAGAIGFIAKQKAAETLTWAIHEAALGRGLRDSLKTTDPAREEHPEEVNHGAEKGKGEPLNARDSALLKLVAEGRSNRIIAARNRISILAVERRLAALMAKLGILSLAKLVEFAVASGNIENDIDVVIV
jgi:DNA-binding NarL/FixJ family response regulator